MKSSEQHLMHLITGNTPPGVFQEQQQQCPAGTGPGSLVPCTAAVLRQPRNTFRHCFLPKNSSIQREKCFHGTIATATLHEDLKLP